MSASIPRSAGSQSDSPKPPKLLDQVRATLRFLNYSLRTEETYLLWIRRSIYFHQVRHPKEMGTPENRDFLTHLAAEGNVSAATQSSLRESPSIFELD